MEKLSSQERILAEILALSENHISGMANKDLAEAVGTTATNACRDLAVFERFGMVERNEKGRWRLSPKFGGLAGQIAKSYQKARLELSREEERYTTAMQ
ncbi:MAG: hypothetical protein NC041_07140 [Bacteroides sp.]|nr:hypothetical protein [Prevotella sp.]MCM1407072.1 hypothetical protein [Treponema brennaborense]MCM1470224.1 hypothetical protein [Bacteroides sp.]